MAVTAAALAAQARTPVDRFWSWVAKTEACWEWQGQRTTAGYGVLRPKSTDRRGIYAHRFSFELHHRPLEPGEEVCHRCDNPPCVNPDHLFAGSHADNMADMARKGRGATRPILGEAHHFARLTDEQVLEIRARCAAGENQHDIAREFGVVNSNVSMIHRRQTWRHLP